MKNTIPVFRLDHPPAHARTYRADDPAHVQRPAVPAAPQVSETYRDAFAEAVLKYNEGDALKTYRDALARAAREVLTEAQGDAGHVDGNRSSSDLAAERRQRSRDAYRDGLPGAQSTVHADGREKNSTELAAEMKRRSRNAYRDGLMGDQ